MTDAPTKDMDNLHLDELTGERVSKTELKKRNKARDVEKRKSEKAAQLVAKPPAKKSAEEEESNLTPNVSQISNVLSIAEVDCRSKPSKYEAGRSRKSDSLVRTHIPTSSKRIRNSKTSSPNMSQSRRENISKMLPYGSLDECTPNERPVLS